MEINKVCIQASFNTEKNALTFNSSSLNTLTIELVRDFASVLDELKMTKGLHGDWTITFRNPISYNQEGLLIYILDNLQFYLFLNALITCNIFFEIAGLISITKRIDVNVIVIQ